PVLNGITGSPYRIGEINAKDIHYEDRSGFGEVVDAEGGLDEPLAFHQMLNSAAEGILVAGVRAYDVTTGRFLSADPLQLGAAPSAIDAADFFRYARDNPIAMRDATGLAPCLQTPEGGCRSNLGEETYEEQRQAAMAHYAANEPEMRALQANANVYWGLRAWADATAQYMATEFPDGQTAEAANSTDARSPSQMEAPTEPVEPGRAAEPQGSRAAGVATANRVSRDTASAGQVVTEDEEDSSEGQSGPEAAEGAPVLADAYGALHRGFGPQFDLTTDAETSASADDAASGFDLAAAFGPAGRGIGPDLRPRTRVTVDPYGPLSDDALAAAPDDIDDFLRPLEEELNGTHSWVKDDWLNRSLGRVTPLGAYGTLSIGLSGAGGYLFGWSEGVGIYHDVSCAMCPGDWTRNWYLYEAKGGRGGNWASYGAGIDVGYSRHASFLGT
ncbi:MAG: RHS repeat-associated core domain-containing protein, partial [Geminicoccaceae bacterium]